jgi:hypothetical protein
MREHGHDLVLGRALLGEKITERVAEAMNVKATG